MFKKAVRISLIIACSFGRIIAAQYEQSDSARCAVALNRPTADSVLIEIHAHVAPFETWRKVPDHYRELIGTALRDVLVMPQPLVVDSYDTRATIANRAASSKYFASVTLRSFYRVTLHRDGRLSGAHVLGGVHNANFDRAIIAAFTALDTSAILPPGDSFRDAFDHDTLALTVSVAPGFIGDVPSARAPEHVAGSTPLFELRVPIYPVDELATGFPTNQSPKFPEGELLAGAGGAIELQFLIRADGTVDPESIYAYEARTVGLLRAAVAAVQRWRFFPMKVAGCSVAAFVQRPFVFGR